MNNENLSTFKKKIVEHFQNFSEEEKEFIKLEDKAPFVDTFNPKEGYDNKTRSELKALALESLESWKLLQASKKRSPLLCKKITLTAEHHSCPNTHIFLDRRALTLDPSKTILAYEGISYSQKKNLRYLSEHFSFPLLFQLNNKNENKLVYGIEDNILTSNTNFLMSNCFIVPVKNSTKRIDVNLFKINNPSLHTNVTLVGPFAFAMGLRDLMLIDKSYFLKVLTYMTQSAAPELYMNTQKELVAIAQKSDTQTLEFEVKFTKTIIPKLLNNYSYADIYHINRYYLGYILNNTFEKSLRKFVSPLLAQTITKRLQDDLLVDNLSSSFDLVTNFFRSFSFAESITQLCARKENKGKELFALIGAYHLNGVQHLINELYPEAPLEIENMWERYKNTTLEETTLNLETYLNEIKSL